jgi:enamine deaminase RidA (YjgF/YER057c/UK114 family)
MSIQHVLFEGHNDKVPPLSLAAAAHNFLFVSGTPGYDPEFRLSPDFSEQLRQAFTRLRDTLTRAGVTPRDVIKTTVLLTRGSDVPEMNRQYGEFFGKAPYPARTTSIVAALPDPRMLVEIECIAVLAGSS